MTAALCVMVDDIRMTLKLMSVKESPGNQVFVDLNNVPNFITSTPNEGTNQANFKTLIILHTTAVDVMSDPSQFLDKALDPSFFY